MRPVAALLVRAYPARWRARYGDEFLGVLEERPLGPFDVADVLLGALDAHLHLRGLGAASEHGKGFAMTLRLGGYAAIIGGVLFFVGLAAASMLGEAGGMFILAFAAGAGALLVALAGLSAFQARRYPRLVWAAFVLPAIGAVVTIVGVIGMVLVGDGRFVGEWSAWYVWSFGLVALVIGSALFATATWLTRSLSRPAAVMLAVSSVLLVTAGMGLGVLSFIPESMAPLLVGAGALAFSAAWIALGVSAVRLDNPGRIASQGVS